MKRIMVRESRIVDRVCDREGSEHGTDSAPTVCFHVVYMCFDSGF